MTTIPTAPARQDQGRPPGPRRRIGLIVAGSLAFGVVSALLLVLAPFIPPEESRLTGAVLLGFGLGWALLAVLSARVTDQPQRWAAVPAAVMGLGGLLLLLVGSSIQAVLSWVWPPALLAVAIWIAVSIHRHLHSRIGRWLLYPVIALMIVASIGGGYETVMESVDARAHPLPGRLIDVGGHRLHLSCTGSGSPTVVLEPGGGEMSAVLGWIAPAVALGTRVCVYDRAGRGWSEPADSRQDAARIATDLRTLLHRGDVPGPYVLAGHSFGGLYVQTFAARFPQDVAGLVLIDSTAPVPAANLPAEPPDEGDSYNLMGRVSALVSASARIGVGRLYGQFDYVTLPPAARDEARASVAKGGQLGSTIDEYVAANASMEQAAALVSFAGKPLVVLSADQGNAPGWTAKQAALAALSANSRLDVVEGATHASLVSDEGDAAVTTQAILDVVASVRSAEPVAR
ncbi:alpha/beta hydrolase [Cryobacterium sp.]|uniref:alpha/beta fold hydrolase n=1 Tax=Cryobacterium sp. TaxID=1926290 RepID=UPI00262F0381|nr:alpha/beta hydrolase [Cryobacterium sp.]MCU1446733.1 alpha/beta hydrolase fold protein [Cryobacterium sp.]